MKQRILYVMDPLCGWTYGNSENFLSFYNSYKEIYDFEILVGGIKINNDISFGGPQMTDYIRMTGALITEMSGAVFSEDFFQNLASNSDYIFDSKPPSKAIVTMRLIDKELAIPFAHRLQIIQFVEGKDISREDVLVDTAVEFQVPKAAFSRMYHSELVSDTTSDDFKKARRMKMDSFPSIYIANGNNLKNIGAGFMSIEEMKKAVAFCYVVFN